MNTMSLLKRIKPKFWDHRDTAADLAGHPFSFRRKWKLLVLLTTTVALIPLLGLAVVNYNLTRRTVEAEVMRETFHLVSNSLRGVSFFLAERKTTMDFILQDNSAGALKDPSRLASILANLKEGIGGFVDLGLIDESGTVAAYAGPYDLKGHNFCGNACYEAVRKNGVYISGIAGSGYPGHHLVMALRHPDGKGGFFVLRATLDARPIGRFLSSMDLGPRGDAFIIDPDGVLQTPSRNYGDVHERTMLPVPEFSADPRVVEMTPARGHTLLVGYAFLPDTSLILMIVKDKDESMAAWAENRTRFFIFLFASIAVMLMAILGMATYLVNRIHQADQRRMMALHQVEYANKMVSIGRLAAGVAHEINNPLAIVNEKAGLLKDIITLKPEMATPERMTALVDDIQEAVSRCGTITHRLLNFATHTSTRVEPLSIVDVIEETLGFFMREAAYRQIGITVDASADIPEMQTDRGSLEQIFLNLFHNAFAAMDDEGHLHIDVRKLDDNTVEAAISDNGKGISEEARRHIFDPFFTTREDEGGTGLGLSVTFGLVQKLGGTITVESEEGRGATFRLVLPAVMPVRRSMEPDAGPGGIRESYT